jgi:hypothetical protein
MIIPAPGATSSGVVMVVGWVMSCKSLPYGKFQFLVDHSCPSLIPRQLQERMAQSKGQQVQNGDRAAMLFSCV